MNQETKQVIYNMMIENTGIHFLDSGGEDGRHWQKNQKKTLKDFENEEYISKAIVGKYMYNFNFQILL